MLLTYVIDLEIEAQREKLTTYIQKVQWASTQVLATFLHKAFRMVGRWLCSHKCEGVNGHGGVSVVYTKLHLRKGINTENSKS